MADIIHTNAAPKAVGPYSQAVRSGNLLFCSGQIAIDPVVGSLINGNTAAQTQQVLQNLEAVLKEVGATKESVIKTTVYLADIADYAAMNEVYAAFFGDHAPARAAFAVAALPAGAMVEIEAIAEI